MMNFSMQSLMKPNMVKAYCELVIMSMKDEDKE